MAGLRIAAVAYSAENAHAVVSAAELVKTAAGYGLGGDLYLVPVKAEDKVFGIREIGTGTGIIDDINVKIPGARGGQ